MPDFLRQIASGAQRFVETWAPVLGEIPPEDLVLGAAVAAAVLGMLGLLLSLRRSGTRERSPEDVEAEVQRLIERNEYSKAGDLRASHGDFEKALAISPNDPVTLYNLGRAYVATGRAAEGIRYVERADQLAGGQVLTVADRLASLYAEQARFAEAAVTARRAASLATRMSDAAAAEALTARASDYETRAKH